MNFSITSCLNKQDYIRVMFIGLYKKPGFILGTILGIYFFATIVLDQLNIIAWYTETPWTEAALGLFMLFAPALIVLMSVNQLKSNPSLLSDVTYTFTDTRMGVKGLTFKSEYLWEHIIKQKETGKFLILYHTKKFGNFIDKEKLTGEQLDFIKAKIKAK